MSVYSFSCLFDSAINIVHKIPFYYILIYTEIRSKTRKETQIKSTELGLKIIYGNKNLILVIDWRLFDEKNHC